MKGPRAARGEGLDHLGGVLEGVAQLALLEDRLVALVEVAQVGGGGRLARLQGVVYRVLYARGRAAGGGALCRPSDLARPRAAAR